MTTERIFHIKSCYARMSEMSRYSQTFLTAVVDICKRANREEAHYADLARMNTIELPLALCLADKKSGSISIALGLETLVLYVADYFSMDSVEKISLYMSPQKLAFEVVYKKNIFKMYSTIDLPPRVAILYEDTECGFIVLRDMRTMQSYQVFNCYTDRPTTIIDGLVDYYIIMADCSTPQYYSFVIGFISLLCAKTIPFQVKTGGETYVFNNRVSNFPYAGL